MERAAAAVAAGEGQVPTPTGRADAPGSKTFLPFSAGPRDCVGQNLAMMEARAVLAAMVGRCGGGWVGGRGRVGRWVPAAAERTPLHARPAAQVPAVTGARDAGPSRGARARADVLDAAVPRRHPAGARGARVSETNERAKSPPTPPLRLLFQCNAQAPPRAPPSKPPPIHTRSLIHPTTCSLSLSMYNSWRTRRPSLPTRPSVCLCWVL